MQNSPYVKPLVWGVCLVLGNLAGNLINKDYFGPLEGTVGGAILGSFATTYLDVMQMRSMSNDNPGAEQ